MSHVLAKRSLHRANLLLKLTEMFTFNKNLDSRLLRLGAVLLFGILSFAVTLTYVWVNPSLDDHSRAVAAFILLGSLALVCLSSCLLFLAIWGAFLAERVLRINAEQEVFESVEKTGPVAREILVLNLAKPEFRQDLDTLLKSVEQSAPKPLDPNVIHERFFTREIVAEAVEALECPAN
ncbi:hypothetical protein [Lacipirellula sp.]|uniref:hypothetical protein n=1 Tax=Lacipirellula sp. TaxID=2691419 RepID=UPI003D142573